MKKIILYVLPALLMIACNSNKPADGTTANSSAAAPKSSNRNDLVGKWKFDNALVKMEGPDGQMLMNDTIKGKPDDYYLVSNDGSIISHIGTMRDTSKFTFVSDDEMVGTNQVNKDSARIKIVSLTASACTLSLKQKKASGSLDMTMFLKR